MDYADLINIVKENKTFLLTTHVNPDADAIGSELGLARFLLKLGKEVRIVNYSETPYTLLFLDKDNLIERFIPEEHSKLLAEYDVLLMLDLNQIERVKSMEGFFRNSNKTKVVIDHHMDCERAFDYYFVNTEYASTGEMIYEFIKESGLTEIDYEIAEPLYAAIMTDTGGFRFERTSPKTHLIAAEMLALGVNPKYVADELYDKNRISRFKLLARALESMRLSNDGKICYISISKKDILETKAVESDIEGFVNYTLGVEGVKIGMLFFELDDGFKVSFRSKDNIPVNKLAGEFGGGGHINAAGTRLPGKKMNEYQNKIIKTAEKYYQKYKN